MSVKIRLSRVGKKHVPFYRIVVVDSRKKRDGKVLADIGTYDVLNTKLVQFDEKLYEDWMKKGALPSDSAKRIHKLFKRKGLAATQKAEPAKAVKKAAPKVALPKKEAEATPKEQPAAEEQAAAVKE